MRLSALTFSCALVAFSAVASAADANTLPTCSVAGLNLAADPDFIASLGPQDAQGFRGARACKSFSRIEHAVEGARVRLTISDLFSDAEGQIKLGARLVEVERMGDAGPRSLGRVVLPPDPLDNETRYEPQVAKAGDAVLLRLSPRHGAVYRLDEAAMVPISAFAWRGQMQADPDLAKAGQTCLSICSAWRGASRCCATAPTARPSPRAPPIRSTSPSCASRWSTAS